MKCMSRTRLETELPRWHPQNSKSYVHPAKSQSTEVTDCNVLAEWKHRRGWPDTEHVCREEKLACRAQHPSMALQRCQMMVLSTNLLIINSSHFTRPISSLTIVNSRRHFQKLVKVRLRESFSPRNECLDRPVVRAHLLPRIRFRLRRARAAWRWYRKCYAT